MTRVRMLKRSAGPVGNRAIGDEIDVPDDEALELVEAKAAEFIVAKPQRESAMLGTQETAVLPAAPPRRRR